MFFQVADFLRQQDQFSAEPMEAGATNRKATDVKRVAPFS